ncbi:MAG: glutamine-hydrolyzing GMP synthase [Chitinispirillaceae bacterium]|nr:glutamine-hydrolyzing GMP synthase [Chitinispirillaceae bacterium]
MNLPADRVVVLDFGGQYAHLIANRIRRLGVYSEIAGAEAEALDLRGYKGIILSGSPHSVLDATSPTIKKELLAIGVPILGLCFGHQLVALLSGGRVARGEIREYGRATLRIVKDTPLFSGIERSQQVWMSHGDTVERLPPHFEVLGSTSDCVAAAMGDEKRRIYGLQFHPEVTDTPCGMTILRNFLAMCGCGNSWNPTAYSKKLIDEIRHQCGNRKAFLLVSGGVDSSVAFALLIEALGPQRVIGLHIDNGLMRLGESADILEYLTQHGFNNLKIEDAGDDFLKALEGVYDPEEKRVIIGTKFIDVKERAFKKLGLDPAEWILAQGTIYPDTIESAGTTHADRIKTHHNRVDVILELIAQGQVVEPLAQLYKDEVRELGRIFGLPRKLLWRHPFPGPGLGVRVLCSEGAGKAPAAGDAQKLSRIASAAGYRSVLLPLRSVGVQGDSRTYAHPALVVGPRDWTALEELSTRITNGLRAVNRVVFGIKTGPTLEYRPVPAFVTKERLDTLRAVDHAITEVLFGSGEYDSLWQMPVVLLPLVNERGGECVVLRPIMSQEAMTARFVPLMEESLAAIVKAAEALPGIGDIFFDVTHKPPATIEWE